MGKFRVALQNHEFLVVQNQIRPLVELRQHRQSVIQFLAKRRASASPSAAFSQSSTNLSTSTGNALPTVIAPAAPHRT